MRKILFILFLACSYTVALSQSGKLKGVVLDDATKSPLELATVSILKQDSSLITYQLSDNNGSFLFEKLPVQQKLLLAITYTGYKGHYSTIQLTSGKTDTVAVALSLNTNDTNGVVVTAKIPVRMNGDTLEINPDAFAMKKDAVVEELLNQVSGLVIWSDGSITVNGIKVQNVLVDGKPFLGSTNPRVATQNLPKAAIDKIQLYQEYDRSKIGQIQQSQDSLLTMNIKLKEDKKKGYFGKAGVGYGTSDRFESDLSLQMYNKRSSLGIGGGMNNINKSFGSLQDIFQNNTYRVVNPNLYNVGQFGSSGINKNYSIGGLLAHSFIETTNSRQSNRLTVTYTASGTDTYISDLGLQNRTALNNPQFITDEGSQNSRTDRHGVEANYMKTNSYNDRLSITGSSSISNDKGISNRYSEVRDQGNQLLSTNSSNTWSTRRADNEYISGSFAKSDSDDPLKSFTLSVNGRRSNSLSERNTQTNFQSFTNPSENKSFNRLYTTTNDAVNFGGTLDHAGFKRLLLGRYNLFGIRMNLNQSFNYSSQSDNTLVNDFDSTNKQYKANGSLSNLNKRELLEYRPTLSLGKSFDKYYSNLFTRSITVQVRLIEEIKKEKNISSFAKRNLDRSFDFFRYEGNINYQYTKTRKHRLSASLNYGKNFSYGLS